jgi:hypothetical protein
MATDRLAPAPWLRILSAILTGEHMFVFGWPFSIFQDDHTSDLYHTFGDADTLILPIFSDPLSFDIRRLGMMY